MQATALSRLTKQLDYVGIWHGGNRFGQRVVCLDFGYLVGVGRQRQHVAAVPEPLRHLDEVDARRQPQDCHRVPEVVQPHAFDHC